MANKADMDSSIKSSLIPSGVDPNTHPDYLQGYPPGWILFTAGYKQMWQLDLDGETWVDMLEAVDSDGE